MNEPPTRQSRCEGIKPQRQKRLGEKLGKNNYDNRDLVRKKAAHKKLWASGSKKATQGFLWATSKKRKRNLNDGQGERAVSEQRQIWYRQSDWENCSGYGNELLVWNRLGRIMFIPLGRRGGERKQKNIQQSLETPGDRLASHHLQKHAHTQARRRPGPTAPLVPAYRYGNHLFWNRIKSCYFSNEQTRG